jgi:putative transposase
VHAHPAVEIGYFLVVETQKGGTGMRVDSSIFASLLKPIDRAEFRALVKRHDADAYDKRFGSWRHLVALLFGQFSGADSLRRIECGFNAASNLHYHLGCGRLSRSTLADANRRRPHALFAELFAALAGQIGRKRRQEGAAMLRLIDSTPIRLADYFDCAASNGRIRGLKLHVVLDPDGDLPRQAAITPANVNDITIGRDTAIEAGATYAFDKGYCHFGWWRQMHDQGATFVTRPKRNIRFAIIRRRRIGKARGEGFRILADHAVRLDSKGDSKLDIPLRRIAIRRDDNGQTFDLVTNDMARPAIAIALTYKARWDIEIFFKWIKQNLKITKFIGRDDNAIRLQLLAAMIAYVLLSIARRLGRTDLSLLRFSQLVAQMLLTRRTISRIQHPPPVNPSKPTQVQHQLALALA